MNEEIFFLITVFGDNSFFEIVLKITRGSLSDNQFENGNKYKHEFNWFLGKKYVDMKIMQIRKISGMVIHESTNKT